VYFEMGQPQGIAPTQCHVGAIPLDEPFALKFYSWPWATWATYKLIKAWHDLSRPTSEKC